MKSSPSGVLFIYLNSFPFDFHGVPTFFLENLTQIALGQILQLNLISNLTQYKHIKEISISIK